MSNIPHIDNDGYTEHQLENESSHSKDEPAQDSQQDFPSITVDYPESGFESHSQFLLAEPTPGEISNLAETPGSTGSMEVTFDCEYDLEACLEDFSRLTRKGKFDAAKDLFESYPSDLKDHPEFVLDFVDTLLKQGAYKTLVDFAADKESTLMKQLSGCGQAPSQYLRSVFELGRRRTFGYLLDSEMKDVGVDEVQSELLVNFENLDSIQVQLLCNILQLDSELVKYTKLPEIIPRNPESVIHSSLNWHNLYKHLLSTNRIWDMRDLFQALCSRYGVGDAIQLFLKNRQKASSRIPESDESEFSGWFHFVFDWTHLSHGDESTDLALLDLLVTISLQLLSHSSQNDPFVRKIINQAMTNANQFAISLSLSNPENVRTSPYLQWALANQKLAREQPSNPRQTPDYKYTKHSQGVIIWTSNLPIYVPLDPHDLSPVLWKRQSRSTAENLLKLGLETSRKNGDYSLVVQYLQEIFYTSESPSEVLTELSHIQEDLQGDKIGYLQTCLTKYLCANDKSAMQNLSNELKEFDENIEESDSIRRIDPLTRWCQRGIQAALHERLNRDRLLTNSYLEKQENGYLELPYDFKRLLAELRKEHSAHKLDSTDKALSKEFTEPCKGIIHRDDNFIICDSSGYFSRLSEETSHD